MHSFTNVLCVFLLTLSASTATSTPPNIVLIISDDQGYSDYGFMGHPAIRTPHLDRLASESALFRRGYVPTALCRPSLASLITGLYAHQHKTTGNDPAATPENQAHADTAGKTAKELLISHIDSTGALPQWLSTQGYASHQSGKWWEGSYSRAGFTDGMTRGYPNKSGRHGDDGLKIGRHGMQPIFEFIDQSVAEQKPFFVWYAPFLPHTPHTPPKRLLDTYISDDRPLSLSKYFAMCEWFDETCGQLLQHIDQQGLTNNTLIFYVTDNGWIQSEKGNGYAPRSKRSPYEFGVRTPIMVRWPGKIPASDRPELISSVDFVPTMLAAAGATGPHDFPGMNLLPYLTSGDTINRDTIFGESFAHDIADIDNPQASLLFRWVIEGNDKLILTYDGRPGKMKYPPESGSPQLFDLRNDPNEKTNLAAQKPQRVEELRALLNDWYHVDQRNAGTLVPTTQTEHRVKRSNRPSP